MKQGLTRLQLLRQERHPLVALAMLAFVVRLGLLVLAGALTPDASFAAGLSGLCEPSKQAQPLSASHDPLSCHCGPVCAHGCATAPCMASHAALAIQHRDHANSFAAPATFQSALPRPAQTRAIRAPPVSLN
ncbi:hypothetical protein [Roseibium sp. M-1]